MINPIRYAEYSLDQMDGLAAALLDEFGSRNIWLFNGEMGAGKTTLISALCKKLGVVDEVSSPTYALAHEYKTLEGSVFHIDAYRIKDDMEAFDAGIDEILGSGEMVFVEWPEKIQSLLPEDALALKISLNGKGRIIEYTLGK